MDDTNFFASNAANLHWQFQTVVESSNYLVPSIVCHNQIKCFRYIELHHGRYGSKQKRWMVSLQYNSLLVWPLLSRIRISNDNLTQVAASCCLQQFVISVHHPHSFVHHVAGSSGSTVAQCLMEAVFQSAANRDQLWWISLRQERS
jgi:hypothetical protein